MYYFSIAKNFSLLLENTTVHKEYYNCANELKKSLIHELYINVPHKYFNCPLNWCDMGGRVLRTGGLSSAKFAELLY